MSLDDLGLKNIPRVPLAFLPTPIVEAPRLAAVVSGPRLWIKRDDKWVMSLSFQTTIEAAAAKGD